MATAYRATAVSQAPDVIRLRAAGALLEVEGQNYGYQVATTVLADVSRAGDVWVPARILHGIVEAMSGTELELALEGLRLEVAGQLQRLSIRTVDGSYALQVEDRATEAMFSTELIALQHAVERVRFVCPREPVNPALEGALLTLDGKFVRLVATDGLRLALATAPVADSGDAAMSMVVPVRTLDEIARLGRTIDEPNVQVAASTNRAQVSFTTSNCRLRSGVIGQQFPNVDRFLSAATSTHLDVDRGALMEILEAGTLLAVGQYRSIRVSCRAPDGVVICTTEGPDGTQRAAIPASIHGQSVTVEMNCEFLRQGAANVASQTLRLGLSDEGPCVLGQPGDDASRYVLGLIKSRPAPA